MDYVVIRKYKGRIIEVRVRDCFIDGRRSTSIRCRYNPILISFSDGTDEKIDYYIRREFKIAQGEIDKNSFVKKLGKIFR